jgi:biopolymer transport protein ExbD
MRRHSTAVTMGQLATILCCVLALGGCAAKTSASTPDGAAPTPSAAPHTMVIHLDATGLLSADQKPTTLAAIGDKLRRAREDRSAPEVIVETDLPQTDARFIALRDKLLEVGVTKFSLASRGL